MTRSFFRLLAVLIVLAGLFVFFCPKVSEFRYQQQVKEQQTIFETLYKPGEAQKTAPVLPELLDAARAYNQSLITQGQEIGGSNTNFAESVLDLSKLGVEDGIFAYISIPVMDICLPVYLGASNANLKLGAAHLAQTSLPISAENSIGTNCVLAGHRGYRGAAMFRNIERLQLGDFVTVTNPWEVLIYEVVEIKVVLPTETECLQIQQGQELLTLITCHPYRSNTHRYVVVCRRT